MNTATAEVIPAARLKLVTDLIAAICPSISPNSLDRLGKPLLASLVAEGLIGECCHIEWFGFFEHGVIAIVWFDDDHSATSHVANVNADGSFEQYR